MSDERFEIKTVWTGNTGSGTSSYTSHERSHEIRAIGKPTLPGSAAPAYQGDATRYNPEELLIASAACHMLWYLHLCAKAGIVVESYEDTASGRRPDASGSGVLAGITLRPLVTIRSGSDPEQATPARRNGQMCFIARSLRCDVSHEPTIVVGS